MKEISLEAIKCVSGGFALELLQNGTAYPIGYFFTMVDGIYRACIYLSGGDICWEITEEMFNLFINSTFG